MDFKSLINKLDGIEAPEKTPQAPTLPKSAQLNEQAQMRVLAGQTTVLAESELMEKKMAADEKAKKDKPVKEADDRAAAKKTEREVELPSGAKVKATKVQGHQSQKADKSADKEKNESIEPVFKSKFMKMVEAAKEESDADAKKKEEKKKKVAKIMDEGAKPDFLDMDGDGDKKEPMKKAVADKKAGPKKGVNPFAKKESVKEADDRAAAKKTEREVTLPSGAKVKATKVQGHQSQKADKAAEKNESVSKEVKNKAKKVVAESVESKLSFKEMIKLVQESGGQQAIDPLDKELFAWAQRVATSKFNEGMKAEVYAGLVYERMGGVFEMYDVLTETKK